MIFIPDHFIKICLDNKVDCETAIELLIFNFIIDNKLQKSILGNLSAKAIDEENQIKLIDVQTSIHGVSDKEEKANGK